MAVVRIQPLEVVTGYDTVDAGMSFGTRFIDGNNFRVSVGTAQNFGPSHADQLQIGDVLGAAGDFDPAVAPRNGFVNDLEIGFLLGAHFALSLAISSAARWIAATIGTYPVQRQSWPS